MFFAAATVNVSSCRDQISLVLHRESEPLDKSVVKTNAEALKKKQKPKEKTQLKCKWETLQWLERFIVQFFSLNIVLKLFFLSALNED